MLIVYHIVIIQESFDKLKKLKVVFDFLLLKKKSQTLTADLSLSLFLYHIIISHLIKINKHAVTPQYIHINPLK